ncbi:MAG: leucyl aminopeptidase [Desulfovibrionaceae bacterium]
MDIRFQTGGPSQWKASVMLVLACKGENPAEMCSACDEASPWFAIAPGLRDFQGETGELTLFHGLPDLAVPRVLVVGLGYRDKVTLEVIRRALGGALAHCRQVGLESVLLPADQLHRLPGGPLRLVEESVLGALLGLYRFTRMRTPKDDDRKDPRWLALGLVSANVPDDVHGAARRGEYAFEGVALARDLANAPANVMTPTAMAEAAQDVARRHQLHCEIFAEDALREMGCNTLLAVSQGSAQEARLIVLEHCPKGFEDTKPLILIGKGLTFDSGGICIKPAANMHIMKSDMSGAAAVLGAMNSIAAQDIPCRVIAVLPCAENMPSGSAMRPGDVVTSYSGKTVEILNTDAEGRLVLCDAITYALKHWTPSALVDIATLTGACAIALGGEVAGLFCDDALLTDRIRAIGGTVGEPFWPLPLWEGYQENLKSEVADISHMGPREGGAIHAALFLKNFVDDKIAWAHLDIAGTDWAFKKTPLSPVGAIGFGVRTLTELARAYSK